MFVGWCFRPYSGGIPTPTPHLPMTVLRLCVRRVLYLDESGTEKGPCSCLVVGGVVVESSGSYLLAGGDLVERVASRLGRVGEVKWRVLRRRGLGEWAFSFVASRLGYVYRRVHVGSVDIAGVVAELAREASADLVVLDEGLWIPAWSAGLGLWLGRLTGSPAYSWLT